VAFDPDRQVVPPTVPTAKPRLEFLPAGQPKSSIRRDDRPRLEGLINQVADQQDVVLIDGGTLPALPTEMLAAACDATYLVIGLGKTAIDDAKDMVDRIQVAGGEVLGCIALDAARS
jgi:Mrp family chromosome partitioning ATPase